MRERTQLNQLGLAIQQNLPRLYFSPPTSKGHIMQLATLIVSSLALVASAATLTVVFVGGKQVRAEVNSVIEAAEAKRLQVKTALEGLL